MFGMVAAIHGAHTNLSVEDGRVEMWGETDASLKVATPDHTVLSEGQPIVRLSVAGDGVEAEIELPAAGVEELQAALDQALATDGEGEA